MIDLTDEMIVYCLPAIQTTKDYKDPVSGKRLPLYRRLRIQKRRRQDEKEVKTFLHSIDPKVGPGWSRGGQDVHGCPAPSALKKGTTTTQSRKIKFSIDRPLGQEEGEVDQVWRYVTPREENMQQHKKMPGEDEDGNEIQFQSVADAYPQSGDRKFVPGISSTDKGGETQAVREGKACFAALLMTKMAWGKTPFVIQNKNKYDSVMVWDTQTDKVECYTNLKTYLSQDAEAMLKWWSKITPTYEASRKEAIEDIYGVI